MRRTNRRTPPEVARRQGEGLARVQRDTLDTLGRDSLAQGAGRWAGLKAMAAGQTLSNAAQKAKRRK